MKGRKLFELLKSLSQEEWKEFKKMLQSPIYNTNDRLLLLYQALKPKYPNFDASQKEKERLFHKVYPGEPFNNYKIHRLFTLMTQVLESYLLLLADRANELEYKQKLLNIYRQRNLPAFFEQGAKQLTKQLDHYPYHDMEYHLAQIQLNNALYFHPQYNKYARDDQFLDRLMDSVDQFFVLAKMRYGISLKSREQIMAKPATWRFMQAMENETQNGLMQDDVLYGLYDKAFELLEDQGSLNFLKFEELLFEHIDHFQLDSKILFFSGLNYINRQVNKGISEFSKTAFRWYRFGLEKELLFDNGQLTEVTFGNIIVYGCREKEYEWTRQFMEECQSYLDEENREEVMRYHYGVCHFYEQDFTQAYTVLINYAFPDSYFLKSRLLAIRAIFENFLLDQDNYDLLNYQIKAFKQGMTRNKIFAPRAIRPVRNTINLIDLLAKKIFKFENKRRIQESLKTKIEETKELVGKEWLLEKVNNL